MNGTGSLAAVDEALLRALWGTPAWLLIAFVVITTIGGGWGMIALIPFLARRASREAAAWLVLTLASTSLVVTTLKAIIGRSRPCDALGWCSPVFGASPGGHSFPSGHASGAFAFAAFVSRLRPSLTAPALAFATAVAWSRCFLGVHYPSDVLAGAALGSTIGLTFAAVYRRRVAARASSRIGSRSMAASPPAPGDSGRPG